MWVAPFGNLRITGYLLLPEAYRSLSRPSSAPDAKAFPLRSFQLDHRRRSSLHSASAFQQKLHIRSLLLLFSPKTGFRRGGRGLRFEFPQRVREIGSLKNYAGFTKIEIVIVTLHPFGCCSTIKICLPRLLTQQPLCCLTSYMSHCSVFKVRLSNLF